MLYSAIRNLLRFFIGTVVSLCLYNFGWFPLIIYTLMVILAMVSYFALKDLSDGFRKSSKLRRIAGEKETPHQIMLSIIINGGGLLVPYTLELSNVVTSYIEKLG